MRFAAAFLVFASVAAAAVEGTVTNGTTGKPQAGASVTLVELGSGMNNLGSVKTDASGKFTFPNDLAPGAPHLLQAQHEGVNYNRMLPPGTPGQGLAVEVFNVSTAPRDAGVSQDMFLLEPSGTEMAVSERIVFTNSGKYTFQDPSGSVKFFVPSGVTGPVQVRILAPQGMPITRPAEQTNEPNTYTVRYPMKPGETNIDVAYTLPMTAEGAKFTGRILHSGGPVRFVAPAGVKLDGPFEQSGNIPGTTATAYTLKGREFDLTVTGTGTLRSSVSGGGGGEQGGGGSEDTGPGIEARKPLIYDRLNAVLALAFAMLAVGFSLLFRRATPARSGGKR